MMSRKKGQKDKKAKRQKDKNIKRQKDKNMKRQKDEIPTPKRKLNFVTSGQFCTLALFWSVPL